MKNEKYISFKSHSIGMENEGKTYDCPKEGEFSLNYGDFSERNRTGNPSFDAYMDVLNNEMQRYAHIGPEQRVALKPVIDKADLFLRKHVGISYEDFLRQSKPEEFTGIDYRDLQTPEQRKALFNLRAGLYLSSLADVEEKGYDIEGVLEQINGCEIPGFKKRGADITYDKVLKLFKNKSIIKKESITRKDKLLEEIIGEQGEIFERYIKNQDASSFYQDIRRLSQKVLDDYDNLSPHEREVADVIYHHLYGIEKALELKD